MTPRAQEIFERALDVEPSERDQFAVRACGGDKALLAEVRSLLESHAAAGEFLKHATVQPPTEATGDMAPTVGPPIAEIADVEAQIGSMIGQFKLLELLGEGGFGRVYLAEQRTPVVRRVALKIIKMGMDTRQVVARFEQERQALAMMEHPSIAKVFEAGATRSGRPYFVMELVRGVSITKYCDQNQLSTRERLELFLPVCSAIQHAHQKGIIHRDLKPGNVLISDEDGKPVPKVIDFGIAKATSAAITVKTVFTAHHVFIGTPTYMSPEQTEPGVMDVDTRTDIYSLGVLLYELLTGSTPFLTSDLLSRGYEEIQRIIREVDPPNPSTRLSESGEQIEGIAARRKTEARKLGSAVRGELDWIVMKAMEKDRQRRYDSAGSFARDVERFLSGEPVAAAPPSAAYRLRKLLHRHRLAAGVSAAVVAALAVGLAGTFWQYRNASRQRDLARAEATRATAEFRRAEAVTDFVVNSLRSQNPYQGGQVGISVAEAMANAREKLRQGALDKDPETKARLLQTISRILRNNFQGADALKLMDEALALEIAQHPGDHEHVAGSLDEIARARLTADDLPGAIDAAEKCLAMRRRLNPGDHPLTASTLKLLGMMSSTLGDRAKNDDKAPHYAAADARYQEALAMNRRLSPGPSAESANILAALARLRRAEGKLAEAADFIRQATDLYEGLGEAGRIGLMTALRTRAGISEAQQDFATTEACLRRVIEINRKVFSDSHQETLSSLDALSRFLVVQRRFPEALELATSAVEVAGRMFPAGDPRIAAYQSRVNQLKEGRDPDGSP